LPDLNAILSAAAVLAAAATLVRIVRASRRADMTTVMRQAAVLAGCSALLCAGRGDPFGVVLGVLLGLALYGAAPAPAAGDA
jgi:hypothetical protein